MGYLFERIVAGNLLNLVKEANIRSKKHRDLPNKINPKESTPRHIEIKRQKVVIESFKSRKRKKSKQTNKQKTISYIRGKCHQAINCFFSTNTAGQREWRDTSKY